MIVLHPDNEQYTALNGYKNKTSEILFVLDGSDKWIVGLEVLNDPNFSEIYNQLNYLERVKFIPFPEPLENN